MATFAVIVSTNSSGFLPKAPALGDTLHQNIPYSRDGSLAPLEVL